MLVRRAEPGSKWISSVRISCGWRGGATGGSGGGTGAGSDGGGGGATGAGAGGGGVGSGEGQRREGQADQAGQARSRRAP